MSTKHLPRRVNHTFTAAAVHKAVGRLKKMRVTDPLATLQDAINALLSEPRRGGAPSKKRSAVKG